MQKDKILLRWAVDQPMAWKIANNYGFVIQRITVVRNNKNLSNPDYVFLSNTPIKAKPRSEWEEAMKTNDRAAIIAQSLFGKDFNVTMPQSGMSSVLAQSEELTQRFTFALMAADQNFEAAQLAGWAWVDTTVKANEKYLYRIYAAVPSSKMRIDTSGVFVGLSDFQELPAPRDVSAAFGNKSVLLNWNYRDFQNIYSSFFVERSEDSINFKKISNLPVTNFLTQGSEVPAMMYCSDTLDENDKTYWYRVRGISSFGEVSTPSVSVKGMGEEGIAYAPDIKNFDVMADSSIQLKWEFPQKGLDKLDHFVLSVSDDADGQYRVLDDKIAATARQVSVKTNMSSNYFVLSAVNKRGRKAESYPQFVQLNDATPPSVPTGLMGEIDDNGYISLKWADNKERDFHGYYVYRSNIKGEEMSLITPEPLHYAEFCDSADLKMLNSKVYYAVAALDKRYNKSVASTVIEVTKPDKIAPTTPVFSEYKLEENKVILSWINGGSEDIAALRLYKKDPTNTKANGQWLLVKEFEPTDSSTYTDENVKGGVTLSYSLVAIDNTKNESPPSVPLTLTVPIDKKNKAAVKSLIGEADRQNRKISLGWVYDEKNVVEYQLYKTVINAPYSLWKVLDNNTLAITDTEVSASNIYKYAIRAIFTDGSMSVMREIKVEF